MVVEAKRTCRCAVTVQYSIYGTLIALKAMETGNAKHLVVVLENIN